nr:inositol monophosphatase family protein [Chloroflexota bacterium]
MESLREYLDFAVETAYLAGRLTLGYFQADTRPEFKTDGSPVTVADRRAEELIRQRIERKYPQHFIVGEEYGEQGSEEASHRWFIDPIDGTKSFVCGVPLYGVLLALEIEGDTKVGVTYFPALDEMIAAASGEGCWWNGRRAHVSNVSHLRQAVVAFTSLSLFERYGRGEAWQRIQAATYYCAGWGDAYGYGLVATGRVDVMLDPVMSVWDSAPLLPILQEAGGYFGDWQGNATIYASEGLAATKALLPQLLALIRGEEAGD